MTELTQEYLDKSLKKLPTKQDLKDAVEDLAGIIKKGFDGVDGQFEELGTRVETLEKGQEDILLKLDRKANKIDLPNFPKHTNHN